MNEQSYFTERTRMWRSRDLEETFTDTLDNVEKCGLELFHITGDSVAPRYSYTVGNFDTSGNPELIVIGLKDQTAQFALNEAASRMKKGVDLASGRHHDIVGEVDVEFRPVDPKWLHQVMPRTDWYYEQADVPVLQLIYPDLEGRFQGEEGFQEYFRQPILTPSHEHGTLEDDFWSASDPDSSLSRWLFPDPPHTRVFLSKTVQEKEEVITYVSHDKDDGAWQFLGDKMAAGGGPLISCLHHPVDDDPTLEELFDLPLGWYAVREKLGGSWRRFKRPNNDARDSYAEEGSPPLIN